MDVDRVCLKCNAKKTEKGTCGSPWHVPNRTGQTRVRAVDFSQEDQRAAFAEQMRRWAAADPESFKAAGFGLGTA